MFLADCLHGLAALGSGGLPALLAAMFVAGLAGGATHCAGMCGPFVLAQAAADAGRAASGGALRRLAGAALLPYQLGRALGYAGLGAVAGGAAGVAARLGAHWLLALPLGLAAAVMLAQAMALLSGRGASWWSGLLRALPAPRLPRAAERLCGRLLAGRGAGSRFALGLLLAGLPCGLLYGALAAAAGAGSALAGAAAMAAFAIGTAPALAGVALLGRFFGRRLGGPVLGRLAGVALLVNAGVLAALAARLLLAGGGTGA